MDDILTEDDPTPKLTHLRKEFALVRMGWTDKYRNKWAPEIAPPVPHHRSLSWILHVPHHTVLGARSD